MGGNAPKWRALFWVGMLRIHQYMVEFQAYRAKLTVKLSARNKLTFYVNYKKMTQDLPKALDNMEILRHTLEQYGSGVTVKLNNGCERWK